MSPSLCLTGNPEQASVEPIEVTSVKHILCGGGKEGVCSSLPPHRIFADPGGESRCKWMKVTHTQASRIQILWTSDGPKYYSKLDI